MQIGTSKSLLAGAFTTGALGGSFGLDLVEKYDLGFKITYDLSVADGTIFNETIKANNSPNIFSVGPNDVNYTISNPDYGTITSAWPVLATATTSGGPLSTSGSAAFLTADIDVDQVLAFLASTAADLPVTVNPLHWEVGSSHLGATVDFADFDVVSSAALSQAFALDANAVAGSLQFEDGTVQNFVFGDQIVLANASSHDLNHDGRIGFTPVGGSSGDNDQRHPPDVRHPLQSRCAEGGRRTTTSVSQASGRTAASISARSTTSTAAPRRRCRCSTVHSASTSPPPWSGLGLRSRGTGVDARGLGDDVAAQAAEACERLLDRRVERVEPVGGHLRRSVRVVLESGRAVIASRRASAERGHLEARVLRALKTGGAPVPRVLAFDGVWLIQQDCGRMRLSQVLAAAGPAEGEIVLAAAIGGLASVHRVGRVTRLDRQVVSIGWRDDWLRSIVDMPHWIGERLPSSAARAAGRRAGRAAAACAPGAGEMGCPAGQRRRARRHLGKMDRLGALRLP